MIWAQLLCQWVTDVCMSYVYDVIQITERDGKSFVYGMRMTWAQLLGHGVKVMCIWYMYLYEPSNWARLVVICIC